jgi:hypothetical protein
MEDQVKSQEQTYKDDPYRSAAREFLALWKEYLGVTESYKAKDVLDTASEKETVDEYGNVITPEQQMPFDGRVAKRLKRPEFYDLLMEQCGERGTINPKQFGIWLRSLRNQVHGLTRIEGDNEVPDGNYRVTIAKQSEHGHRWKLEQVSGQAV